MPGSTLRVTIEHDPAAPSWACDIWVDGHPIPAGDTIPLPTDGREHQVLFRTPAVRPHPVDN